jgi:hypothetical protein
MLPLPLRDGLPMPYYHEAIFDRTKNYSSIMPSCCTINAGGSLRACQRTGSMRQQILVLFVYFPRA